jgi:hypothetical protein
LCLDSCGGFSNFNTPAPFFGSNWQLKSFGEGNRKQNILWWAETYRQWWWIHKAILASCNFSVNTSEKFIMTEFTQYVDVLRHKKIHSGTTVVVTLRETGATFVGVFGVYWQTCVAAGSATAIVSCVGSAELLKSIVI